MLCKAVTYTGTSLAVCSQVWPHTALAEATRSRIRNAAKAAAGGNAAAQAGGTDFLLGEAERVLLSGLDPSILRRHLDFSSH